jgi:uncharacterized membrane protein YeaQ/YmgE (transglycosylase-associated protein family)
MGGIFNIIVGLVFVAGGLSGKLSFRFLGSGSEPVVVAVGGALVAWGAYRLYRSRRGRGGERPTG